MSVFFIFLIATISCVCLFRHTRTSPKAPLPISFTGSKSKTEILARLQSHTRGVESENLLHAQKLSFLVKNLRLDQTLLLLGQLQSLHLSCQLFPSFSLLLLVILLSCVFAFNVSFGTFGSLSCGIGRLQCLSTHLRLVRLIRFLLRFGFVRLALRRLRPTTHTTTKNQTRLAKAQHLPPNFPNLDSLTTRLNFL